MDQSQLPCHTHHFNKQRLLFPFELQTEHRNITTCPGHIYNQEPFNSLGSQETESTRYPLFYHSQPIEQHIFNKGGQLTRKLQSAPGERFKIVTALAKWKSACTTLSKGMYTLSAYTNISLGVVSLKKKKKRYLFPNQLHFILPVKASLKGKQSLLKRHSLRKSQIHNAIHFLHIPRK